MNLNTCLLQGSMKQKNSQVLLTTILQGNKLYPIVQWNSSLCHNNFWACRLTQQDLIEKIKDNYTYRNFISRSYITTEKKSKAPWVREALTLAKLSSLRNSRANEAVLALYSEGSNDNNDFSGKRLPKVQAPSKPLYPNSSNLNSSRKHWWSSADICLSVFCCSILNNHLYSSWPTQITSSDLFPLANWLNSTLEVEINLFSHCYGLQQALFTPLVSSSSSRWIWNGFLCKQGCVTERNVQTYQESCRVAVNLRGGRQPPPD